MKYAKEVLDLMSAFPGREWRMAELVRDASGGRELARRGATPCAEPSCACSRRCRIAARCSASSTRAIR